MREEEIAQYNQCSEDWRHYGNAIWQMPTVAITIASVILAVAYQYVQESVPRFVILLLGGLLLLSITVALIKHRLFLEQRTEFLLDTENDWVHSKRATRTIKRMTAEIGQLPWHRRRIAYKWLLSAMIIATLSLFGLAFHSLYLMLN